MKARTYKKLLRLNQDEQERLRYLSKSTGLNQEQVLRKVLMDAPLLERPTADYIKMSRQIASLGNNLNQLAHIANASGKVSNTDLLTAKQIMEQKPLAPKTIREYVLFANQVLHFANERYHSVQAEFKKPEKGTRPRFVDCIHEDEVKKLMAEISKYPIQEQAIVLSLLNTGVRRAELAGLTWSDFNFRDCTVHVNKSLLVFKDFGYQHTTTKESNDRYIDVAPEYMTFMQRYKEWWDTKKKLMGASWQRDMVTNKEDKRESLMKLVGQEFVIIDDFGWPRNPDGYNKLVKRVAQKAGISDIHPHMFRHTFVSLLMSNPDIGVATVAAEAGHAQPSTTLMIYTQQYKKRRESIRNQLSRELYEK